MEITNFTAEKYEDYIRLYMEVDGVPGAKAVPLDADLKVEGEKLAQEIIEGNTPQPEEKVVEPVPVDVSNIVLEIK